MSLTNTPGTLYRYFDRNGVLLYVGATTQGSKVRWDQHQVGSPWHIFVARRTEQEFAKAGDIYDAERAAIRLEQPIFNRRHNQTRDAQLRLIGYLTEHGRLDLYPEVAIKLNREQVELLDEQLMARAVSETGGNRTEMTRRMIAFALANMPVGWAPPEVTEAHMLGLETYPGLRPTDIASDQAGVNIIPSGGRHD